MKSKGTFVRAILLAALFAFLRAAPAQITITSNDLLALRGKAQRVEDDTTGSIVVNVGSAGANQTWDFRALVLQAETSTNQFLAPQNTPFASQFPQSNFVQKFLFDAEPDFQSYIYFQVASNSLSVLGAAFQSPDTTLVVADSQEITPLPLQLGVSWNHVESDTFGDPQTFLTITTTSESFLVDAWGRVRLPIGDFDCLRLRINNQTISTTIVLGNVLFSDTTNSIGYSWLSKNDFQVAQATSQDGETNPNFTTAASFSRLISLTTGVEAGAETQAAPADFELLQNFPNPFNPETQIKFYLSKAGQVELAIYNLTGERLRHLISAALPAGWHAVTWDGKDENGNGLPSGVYWYRLRNGVAEQSKTMLLLR